MPREYLVEMDMVGMWSMVWCESNMTNRRLEELALCSIIDLN